MFDVSSQGRHRTGYMDMYDIIQYQTSCMRESGTEARYDLDLVTWQSIPIPVSAAFAFHNESGLVGVSEFFMTEQCLF